MLTGGGSQLTGLPELAANMFGSARAAWPPALDERPCRPWRVRPISPPAIGLLLHWARGDDRLSGRREQRFLRTGTGYFAKVGDWIRDNF